MEVIHTKKQGASLGRILQHVKGAGFGIITSWRQGFSRSKNMNLLRQLKASIRRAGYGFIELDGYWADEEATEAGHEPSLFIPAVQKRLTADALPREVMHFENWMLRIAKTYNQDGFILGDGESVYLVMQNGQRQNIGRFSADRVSQAWSKIKKGPHRGRSFIFATRGIPSGQIEAVQREAEGEIWSMKALTRLVESGAVHTPNYPPKAPKLIQRLATQELQSLN